MNTTLWCHPAAVQCSRRAQVWTVNLHCCNMVTREGAKLVIYASLFSSMS